METSKVGPILLGVAITGATGLCLYLLVKNHNELERKLASTRPQLITLSISLSDLDIVLGKHGANLREIQSRTGTTITFEQGAETAKFSIHGCADSVVLAEILIQQTINAQPRLEKSQIQLPKHAVSTILGRSEHKKRTIELASRCKILVEREGEDTVLELSGTRGQIEEAKRIVRESLNQLESINASITNKSSSVGRVGYEQPLFLKYETEADEEGHVVLSQAELNCSGSDQLTQVYVSCVASPGQFWVQNVGPSSIQLDKLTQAMTEYYSATENQLFHSLAVDGVRKGDIVVSTFSGDSNYYRAKVVDVSLNEYDGSKSNLDLDFIDYGDSEVKPISEVFEIKTEFLKLHFQAIPCKLANIRSLVADWSEESIIMFENASHCATWKPILARIIQNTSPSKTEDNTAVELFVSADSGERSIGEEMVRQGLARFIKS